MCFPIRLEDDIQVAGQFKKSIAFMVCFTIALMKSPIDDFIFGRIYVGI